MTTTTSLYATCERLFADYPLAINDNGAMTLMLDTGRDPEFFILIPWDGDGDLDACFDLIRWRNPDAVGRIEAHTGTEDAPDAARILATAVPLPYDGSMFGWLDRGEVTALLPVYAHYSQKIPVPSWSVCPRVGAPQWPPFVGASIAEARFWDHYQAGQIVNLAPLIAETPRSVFWVQAPAPLHGVCVVAHDVTAPQGWVLPQGAYVYSDTLSDGVPVPSLDDLLADPGLTDLAPRFQER